ncbi:hypothetical protein [Rhizobium halophytocola]|uniref:Tail fiber protein n=1 Tax=Rhizobium halophytocola TaxID=735519 RepID=A0ABS4E2F7_9HYPH|nr:hypothetical protein [Rhizobium halophytocola]MBP1852114.1 hypothetical protein [Rhizobium halophytocola]
MTVENVTVNQHYPLPDPSNATADDVLHLIDALQAIDIDVVTIFGQLVQKAGVNSPNLAGTPTAPTQPAGSNDNTIATTGHVQLALNAFVNEASSAIQVVQDLQAALGDNDLADALTQQLQEKAPLASPALTGTPTAPTPDTADNGNIIATTAFVQAVKAAVLGPVAAKFDTLAKLAAAMGGDENFATTLNQALALKAPLASPVFTGTPSAPTQGLGEDSTRLANTAFVQNALDDFSTSLATTLGSYAKLASPGLTGNPTVPTQAAGNNSTRIANTAFVTGAVNAAKQLADNASQLGGQAPGYYLALANATGTLNNARLSGDYSFGNLTLSGEIIANGGVRFNGGSNYDGITYDDGDNSYSFFSDGSVSGTIIRAGRYLDASGNDVVYDTRTLTAGNGLSGGGNLAANRTFTLGTPSSITNSTSNSVSSTTHSHALGFVAAEVYTGSSSTVTNYPVGHFIAVYKSAANAINATLIPCLNTNKNYLFVDASHGDAGSALSGTWRTRGTVGDYYYIAQRVA